MERAVLTPLTPHPHPHLHLQPTLPLTLTSCLELLARAGEELGQASAELELLKHDYRSVGAALNLALALALALALFLPLPLFLPLALPLALPLPLPLTLPLTLTRWGQRRLLNCRRATRRAP